MIAGELKNESGRPAQLTCRDCGAVWSAHRGDYFLLTDDTELACGCGSRDLVLVRPMRNRPTGVQATKKDLIRIAHALGLEADKSETSKGLVDRCVERATELRRELGQVPPCNDTRQDGTL